MSLLATLAACGGGGGSDAPPPQSPWPQFRSDPGRSGGFGGNLLANRGALRFAPVDDGDSPAPISASPAVGIDGVIYLGSEGGTLKAFAADDLSTRWSTTECAACCADSASPSCDPTLGPLVSSPTITRAIDGTTTLAIGDTRGRVFRYTVNELAAEPVAVCEACFVPELEPDFGTQASAAFRSSPAFSFNLITGTIAATVIGAEISTGTGAEPSAGKLYSINVDGTTRWQYPARGDGAIGPITSSPAIGIGGAIVFTAGDDMLYILTRNGTLRRRVSLAGLTASDGFLQPSVVASSSLLVGTAGGDVYAFNHDGTFRWAVNLPGRRFLNSLSVGLQSEPSPTPTPTAAGTATQTPTQDPNVPTPTFTPTPTAITDFSTVIGVASDGEVIFLDSSTGTVQSPTGNGSVLVEDSTVRSSPSLSFDGFITFATDGGHVYVVDTGDGEFPAFCVDADTVLCSTDENCPEGDSCDASFWPIRIPARCMDSVNAGDECTDDDDCPAGTCTSAAIVSSPALDDSGVIYVGAEDGFLYAIGATGTPARSPTPTPSPAAAGAATNP